MSSLKSPLTPDELRSARTTLFSRMQPMISEWSAQQVGSLQNWIAFFRQIMETVQSTWNIPGVQKAELCIEVLQDIAQALIDENPAHLTDTELQTVKIVLSSEGLHLLQASTAFLKQLIRSVDRDNDGEISLEECANFCCPFLGKRKPSKRA